MFKKQTRIIAIDNNPDHLSILTKNFHDNGIGCLPILYNQLSPPQTPFTNVRLAFFDINLRDTTNNSEIFNDLSNALNDYIDKENGPFALIFWTQNHAIVEDLINYINQRRSETPQPYLVKCIDKDKFLNESLEIELGQILSSPTLKLLLDFEENAQESASSVINSIYNLIPKSQNWGDFSLFETNFDLIFSKIAISALGYHHAKENPDKAIYEALSPIIANKLISSNFGTEWNSILNSLSSSKQNNQPSYPRDFNISKLNSIFHIDESIPSSKINRGVVVNVDSNDPFFKANFDIQYTEWFARLLLGLNKSIRNESRLIAVEISASCDFSQKKPRTYKLMLGVLVKEVNAGSIESSKIPQNLLSLDSVFNISGENMNVFFNLNYVFSVNESDNLLGNSLFTFKKEIMDMIGNRYANHVSRIGITSF